MLRCALRGHFVPLIAKHNQNRLTYFTLSAEVVSLVPVFVIRHNCTLLFPATSLFSIGFSRRCLFALLRILSVFYQTTKRLPIPIFLGRIHLWHFWRSEVYTNSNWRVLSPRIEFAVWWLYKYHYTLKRISRDIVRISRLMCPFGAVLVVSYPLLIFTLQRYGGFSIFARKNIYLTNKT